jgi:hypothetical protein
MNEYVILCTPVLEKRNSSFFENAKVIIGLFAEALALLSTK